MNVERGERLTERLVAAVEESDEAWQPRFYRLATPEDREAMAALLTEVQGLRVYDAIEEQLIDLIKTRSPSRRLTDDAARALIPGQLGDTPREHYGVWVHYPWSRRLVHLLDEAEFIELRTNRNKYKLTPAEQARLATRRVGVVGLSVGQMVATTLALERSVGELRLADFDRLDLSNLNRIRSGVHNLGVSKVLITAREIAEIDPFLRVVLYPVGVHDDNIHAFLLKGGKLDVLIDECDSIDIKLKLRAAARMHRIPVVMETSDRTLIDIERFDLEPSRPIFHGLVGNIDPERLANLSTEEKIPYVLKIVGQDTMSSRMVSSMAEIESSIKTWPQLGSCVVYGGGATADIVRRINLGQLNYSGRFIGDIENLVPNDRHDVIVEPDEPRPPALTAERMVAAADDLSRPADIVPWGDELARELVSLAAQAPSGGNTQPWRWLARDGRLLLFHERARSECLADYRGLGGVVALGAAVESFRLAAHARGHELAIETFPCAREPDLAAVFERLPTAGSRAEPRWRDDLAELLGARHTNRKNGPRRPLEPAVVDAFAAAVASVPGAELRLLAGETELAEAAELLGAGDRLRITHGRLNREMFREIRWTAEEAAATRDGLFVDALELSAPDRAGLAMCQRTEAMAFLPTIEGSGRGLHKMAGKAVGAASAVGLLIMPRVSPHDFLLGGRAMQRFWLTAHAHEVAVYPMTTLAYMFTRLHHGDGEDLDARTVGELRGLWPRYARLFSVAPEHAQILLFRLSRAEAPSMRSLRRGVDEILHVSER